MACGSCGSRRPGQRAVPTKVSARHGRTVYEVVLPGGAVAFQTNNVDLARKVAGNYAGAKLNPDPDAASETAAEEVTISAPKTRRTKAAEPAEEVTPDEG